MNYIYKVTHILIPSYAKNIFSHEKESVILTETLSFYTLYCHLLAFLNIIRQCKKTKLKLKIVFNNLFDLLSKKKNCVIFSYHKDRVLA